MSDAWFQNEIAPDGVAADGCRTQEAQALKALFEGKTTATEPAFAIKLLLDRQDYPLEKIGGFWGLLEDAMMELSSERRIQTIGLLKKIERISHKGANACFPGFGHIWADGKQWSWRTNLHDPRRRTREEVKQWFRKRAAVEAEMVVSEVQCLDVVYGLIIIADALESSHAILDIELPAVYEWLTTGIQAIIDSVDSRFCVFPSVIERDLYRISDGPRGIPLDNCRLSFWISRLQEIAASIDGLDLETRAGVESSIKILSETIQPECLAKIAYDERCGSISRACG